jgi:MFS family permease
MAITIFSMTVFTGPLLAPFVGGFIVMSHLGWRWTEYIVCIMGFVAFTLNLLFLAESYPPEILVSKAAELRRRTKVCLPARSRSHNNTDLCVELGHPRQAGRDRSRLPRTAREELLKANSHALH